MDTAAQTPATIQADNLLPPLEPPPDWQPGSGPTEAIATYICRMIAAGHSLASICAQQGMPSVDSVYDWLEVHGQLQVQYTRARERQADVHAQRIEYVARRTLMGEYNPKAAAVAMGGFQWLAARLKPKVYGDNQRHTHEHHLMRPADELPDAELARIAQSRPVIDATYAEVALPAPKKAQDGSG